MKKRIVAIILVGILGFILLQVDYSVSNIGSYQYYVSNWDQVGIPNLVTAILADWRVYDSLGEAVILFTAITGSYLLLGGGEE